MRYFIEGNSKRYFLNTTIGCQASCSYCYLSNSKFNEMRNKSVQPIEIINYLKNYTDLKKGRLGSIFSIGCYSECWHNINKQKTIELLELLLEWGNPVQISTKMEIKLSDLKSVKKKIQWKNQLSIYISCPLFTDSDEYEKGVKKPKHRLRSINICSTLNIPAILYVKPVLKNLTIRDLKNYIGIVKKYKIPVIVGESFTFKKNNSPAPVGNGHLFCNKITKDQLKIVEELSNYTNVFYHSTELVEIYRNGGI